MKEEKEKIEMLCRLLRVVAEDEDGLTKHVIYYVVGELESIMVQEKKDLTKLNPL